MPTTYEIEIRITQQSLDIGPPGSPFFANNLEVYNGKIGLKIPDDFPTEIPGGVINVDDSSGGNNIGGEGDGTEL